MLDILVQSLYQNWPLCEFERSMPRGQFKEYLYALRYFEALDGFELCIRRINICRYMNLLQTFGTQRSIVVEVRSKESDMREQSGEKKWNSAKF